MPRMSTIFITGGAGFIGSHLVHRLAKEHKVTVFDNYRKDSLAALGYDQDPNVTIVKGDILDATLVKESMKGADYVIHAAAIVGVIDVMNQLKTMEVNILGTHNVLEAAHELGVSERVIVFSSSEIFGKMAYKVTEEDSVRSGPPWEARWGYSVSKIACEHFAAGFHRAHNMPVTCVRPFNVYGPGQTMGGAMKMFITKALQNEDISIHGDGSPIRSWCYVDDFCNAIERCMKDPNAIGESFNIGNSKTAITVLGLAELVIELLNSQSSILHGEPLLQEIHLRIPDVSKAKTLLGWEAMTDLKTGIQKTAESVKKELSL
ncbi:MAG: NAD(P)-dependent oxidoreductase [Candidatus Peregrinibacteria bacterium]|nr:NAD(P)-dependent oxidoreductase [Candidatus Peregrinibacteria bacterium]MCB9807983.1 NAD(P)-dependent oxidoreductase [Candidatus Peribacteria bacterium]